MDNPNEVIKYLFENESDRPKRLDNLFKKLRLYRSSGSNLEKVYKQLENSIQETSDNMHKINGSIHAVTDLIIEGLTDQEMNNINAKIKES